MTFGTLALLVAAGLVGPALATVHRFAPPAVVGEIAAGVVIGTTGFGWIDTHDPALRTLSDIGFALLMFIVGTHLPLRDEGLRRGLRKGFALALTTAVFAAVAALALAPHIGYDRPAVIATIIATSSAAVALPVVQSRPADRPSLVVTTAWITVADIGSVLALPLVTSTARVVRIVSGGLLVTGGATLVYLLARRVVARRYVQALRRQSRAYGWALDLRASILILFALAYLATELGASVLLAGFATGAVVALLGEPRRVAQQLIGLGEGFFVPLFFVDLGARLDLRALVHEPRTIVLGASILVAAAAAHLAAAALWRMPISAGLLATAQLGVPSAVVSIGLGNGSLAPAQGAAIMTAVLGSLALCALGAGLIGPGRRITDHAAPETLD